MLGGRNMLGAPQNMGMPYPSASPQDRTKDARHSPAPTQSATQQVRNVQ